MAPFKSRSIKKNETLDFLSPLEFASWIQTLGSRFSERSVVLLEGQLGSGKTFFVQELVKIFGGDVATSPSFAIHNRYESTRGLIDHIDLYRLNDFDDLESTGFWDLFSVPKGLILIEWGDRLPVADLPFDWTVYKIKIEMGPLDSAASSTSREERRVSLSEFD
ncbi:MAG: tRNA (adenosine(37)-N6)-threonylcarbamoyltransferase complex ATPase subunit type 1 TsaE [Pseudomonadota bacterium]|nr:tRNA (adenosine(37)-N6)-threonylcarbamoyltransferase complex ATPase subunit type 1 TsaE [Pseudomonadota bacterium]